MAFPLINCSTSSGVAGLGTKTSGIVCRANRSLGPSQSLVCQRTYSLPATEQKKLQRQFDTSTGSLISLLLRPKELHSQIFYYTFRHNGMNYLFSRYCEYCCYLN